MDKAIGAEVGRRHGVKRLLKEADLRFFHAPAGLAEASLRSQEALAAPHRLSGSSLCWQLSHHAPPPHLDRPLLQPNNRLELISAQHEQAEQCIIQFAKPACDWSTCHKYRGVAAIASSNTNRAALTSYPTCCADAWLTSGADCFMGPCQ